MAVPLCDECKAIYRELVAMVEMSRRSDPGPGATPQQMAAWFDQRGTDENYNMRIQPAMWALGRRLMEHQILTGHTIPSITPLGGPPQEIESEHGCHRASLTDCRRLVELPDQRQEPDKRSGKRRIRLANWRQSPYHRQTWTVEQGQEPRRGPRAPNRPHPHPSEDSVD